jgi:hypothetical protein
MKGFQMHKSGIRKSGLAGIFLFVGIFFFICPLASGGQWAKTYGGAGFDSANSIQQTLDGGFIVAGSTSSFSEGNHDVWVIKLDINGNIQWQNTYGGTGDDYASAIQPNANGGYIIAGKTDSLGAGSYDIWLLRLYSNGVVQWQKAYGGMSNDYASAIQQTSDGGYIVAGSTDSFGAGSYDVWLLKVSSNGGIQWQKTYGGASDDYASSIQKTSDGGFIVSGSTNSFGAEGYDLWVLKMDAVGNVQWQKTYGGTGDDYVNSIQQTKNPVNIADGYIVAGTTHSFGAVGADSWVVKLNLNGNILWQKSYGSTGDDSANSIQQTSDGGYIVAGSTTSADVNDFWVLKLDTKGNVSWQKTYSGTDQNSANSIRQTSDGGYIVAGSTNSFGEGDSDFLVLKLHNNGDIAGCPGVRTSNERVNNTAALVQTIDVKGVGTTVSPVVTALNKVETASAGELICDAELTLYSPKGGEVIPSGSMYAIEWGAGIESVKFDLLYSMDNGTTWIPIVNNITAMNYNWQVPILTETKDKCLIKLKAYDHSGMTVGEVTSDKTFAIAVLSILQPNGGETLTSGTVYMMKWKIGTINPVAKENLYYTEDGGDSWKLITSRTGSADTYPWEVPWVTSTKNSCKIKVELLDVNGRVVGADKSDKFFTIQPFNPPPVMVTSPNGGQTLTSGEKYSITWETNGVPNVAKAVLFYTVDSGTTWTKITALTGNPGMCSWTLPTVTSQTCKVKVVLKDALGTALGTDVSDGNFSMQY